MTTIFLNGNYKISDLIKIIHDADLLNKNLEEYYDIPQENRGASLLDRRPELEKKTPPVYYPVRESHNTILNSLKDLKRQCVTFNGTFNDRKTINGSKRDKIDDIKLHQMVRAKLKNSHAWKSVNYMLFPEYDQNGRYHFHGIIYDSYECLAMRCKRMWAQTFGFAKVDMKITSREQWFKYMQKDYKKSGLSVISQIGEIDYIYPLTKNTRGSQAESSLSIIIERDRSCIWDIDYGIDKMV